MKKITEKDYQEWIEYKKDKTHGRLLTSDGIRLICKANNYDPEKIGVEILKTLAKINRQERR